MFAGTVETVEPPFLFESYDSSTIVRLRVDTVWRGDPPAALLAYGGGLCSTMLPAPGWPFVICDDGSQDWTVIAMCVAPRFGPATDFYEAFGPGRPPTAPPVLEWQGWRTRELLVSLAVILVFPLAASVLGAGVGWFVRRRAARPARAPIRRVLAFAAAVIVGRLIARSMLSEDTRYSYVALVVVGLATLVGLWLGYRGQRGAAPGKALRGLAFALLGTGLMLFAGFVRLHFPVQPRDSVACSQERAREFLRTVPIDFNFDRDDPDYYYEDDPSPATVAFHDEAFRLAEEAVPYACTDWGLRRMRFDRWGYRGPCVEFDDALGGSYRMCARMAFAQYDEEPPG